MPPEGSTGSAVVTTFCEIGGNGGNARDNCEFVRSVTSENVTLPDGESDPCETVGGS